MVLRSYPIRVSGDSGPLPNELSWEEVTVRAKSKTPIREYTSVTKNLRRVGAFDADVVLRAIAANRPDLLVLNHMDYIPDASAPDDSEREQFLENVQSQLGTKIDYIGIDPETVYPT